MRSLLRNKKGFGITEVLISSVVLGFLYLAVLHMQVGNRETLLRIRGRDGAIEVAQQLLDSLNRIGLASIPDSSQNCPEVDEAGNCVISDLPKISRSWDRGVGSGDDNKSVIEYTPKITVYPVENYTAKSESSYDTVSHVFAKQVNVEVSWQFKGSTQSINMSTIIR